MVKNLMLFTKAKTNMRNVFLLGIVFAGTCALPACSEDETNKSVGTGELRVELNTSSEVSVLTKASENDPNAPVEGDFTIYISGVLENKELTYAQLSDPISLKEGIYSIKAVAGQTDAEGFVGKDSYEKPWYQGEETSVTIVGGQPTTVNLTATLQNAKVSVEYTTAFKNYFADYDVNISLQSSKGTGYFIFDMDEEYEPLYLIPGTLELNVDIAGAQGAIPHYNETFAISGQAHYNLIFDVETETGDATLNISFLGPEDEDLGEINLAD